MFLYSRATGAVTLVSHSTASGVSTGNAASSAPLISADGNYVVFSSLATNLVAGQSDVNAAADLFLWARSTGVITLVSHAANSLVTTAGAGSSATHINADGGFVAFYSTATNLVTGQIDSNGTYDAFLYSRATGGVALVSHTPTASIVAGGAASFTSNMSADGAYVTFSSERDQPGHQPERHQRCLRHLPLHPGHGRGDARLPHAHRRHPRRQRHQLRPPDQRRRRVDRLAVLRHQPGHRRRATPITSATPSCTTGPRAR